MTGMTIVFGGENGCERVYTKKKDNPEGTTNESNDDNNGAKDNSTERDVEEARTELNFTDEASVDTMFTGINMYSSLTVTNINNTQKPESDGESQNTNFTGLTMMSEACNGTPSITNVIEGINNLNLESNTISGEDDCTVFSGLMMDKHPDTQNNNENQQSKTKEDEHQEFQKGGVN
eukprot:12840252-Ditylum_brightwellii.AAC.1